MFDICKNSSNKNTIEINNNMTMDICDLLKWLNQIKTEMNQTRINQTREQNIKPFITDIETISQFVIKIVSPILFSLGIVGNFLTILILLKKKNRGTSTAVLLTVLAFSDLVIILTGLFSQWMEAMWNWDIRTVNNVFCKIHVFLTYFSVHLSSWLLCLITFERILCVFIPHKVKLVFGRKQSLLSIAVLAIILVLINGHLVVGMELWQSTGLSNCNVPVSAVSYMDFFGRIWPWIDLSISFVAPFVLIITGNIAIVVQLHRVRRQRKLMGAPRQKLQTLTMFLFLLSLVFIVSMSPVMVYNAVISNTYITNVDLLLNHPHTISILTVVMGFNPTMNFILYVLTGSKFRAEVKALLCCRKSMAETVF